MTKGKLPKEMITEELVQAANSGDDKLFMGVFFEELSRLHLNDEFLKRLVGYFNHLDEDTMIDRIAWNVKIHDSVLKRRIKRL